MDKRTDEKVALATESLPPAPATPTNLLSPPLLSSGSGECASMQNVEPEEDMDVSQAGDIHVGTPCVGDGSYVHVDSEPDTPMFATPVGKHSPYVPPTPDMRNIGELPGGTTPFLTSAAQLHVLISNINKTSQCKAEGCNGVLRLKNVELVGMGGDGQACFSCSGGCGTRDILLPCSEFHEKSKQSVVSLALQIAFICSGANYAQYETVLGSLGMHPVSDKRFYDTIKLLYGPVEEILDGQCELAKKTMKDMPSSEIGSWDRAITVADGVWMTKGHHSQNFTFHIRDYVRNSVLYYLHLCQRGKDNVCKEDLYKGTSKSCEGFAAERVFRQMKDDGMTIVTHWQDNDSTSANEVKKNFGDNVPKLCSGHYTRAHFNRLKKIKQQKCFGPVEQSKHKDTFPDVIHSKCKCKVHRQGCGCMTDPFISMSRHKLFGAVVDAGKDPNFLRARLKMLPHHACDDHKWEDGECDFHALQVCSCGKCDSGDIHCKGKKYTTRHKLTCEFHSLAYKIECHSRSGQAEQVIDTELGGGHTNQLESANSTLIRFRRKDLNLKRLHYHVSTNLGLLESNLTFMHSMKGTEYHWLPELYEKVGLPDFDGVRAYYKKKNRARDTRRLYRRSVTYKKRVAAAKHVHRVTEQQQRQDYGKARKITHTYEANVGYSDEPQHSESSKSMACACGSTTHKRKTHKSCPLNPLNQAGSSKHSFTTAERAESDDYSDFDGFDSDVCSLDLTDEEEELSSSEESKICDCGKAHKRDCPLNPRNIGNQKQYTAEAKKKGQETTTVSRKGKTVVSMGHRKRQSTHLIDSPISKIHVSTPKKRRHAQARRLHVRVCSPESKPEERMHVQGNVTPDCLIGAVIPGPREILVNPPDREWMSRAKKYLHEWSKSPLDDEEEGDSISSNVDIAPHIVDRIKGDGHCLFRAISKTVTGTQNNHRAVRKAMVQWMLCRDHPPQLTKYVGQTVSEYIRESKMSGNAWATDKEIAALATMLQTDIYVSNVSISRRRWNIFSPLFCDDVTCMGKSNYKLYLYHSDSKNHYDRVIPKTK